MGPFIPPLPIESCVAAFLWIITTYLVSTISTTSITDYICLTVQSNQQIIHFIQQYSWKSSLQWYNARSNQ